MRTPGRTAIVATFTLLLLAGGCNEELGDRESEGGADADEIGDVYNVVVSRNIDNFPNVATFCVEGLGFWATSSADGTRAPSAGRLPELDQECAR